MFELPIIISLLVDSVATSTLLPIIILLFPVDTPIPAELPIAIFPEPEYIDLKLLYPKPILVLP